jgi:KDO2-lipid IV(A) lauroyltransferase
VNSEPVIATLFGLLGLIPRNWASRLSDVIGHIMFLADKKHRKIALDNLSYAFADEKNPTEIRILGRQIFKNLVRVVFEIGWSLRLEIKDFDKHFRIEGLSNLRSAYEKDKGVLILTAHLGNWELLTIIAAMIGYPTSIVVRPLDFLPLERFFGKLRTRFGGRLIPKDSMRTVLGSLKQRNIVGLLMDQNVDWYEGVFVDFLGRVCCTSKGLALLALKTKTPVVPLFLVRETWGFKAEVGQEVPLVKTGDMRKDIEANTQGYNRVIESFVRRYPDQWFWVHQRWKTRPYCPWPREQ